MADEVLDGAPEGAAEVTDLRSTIRAAVEAQREPAAADVPEPVEAVEAEKPEKAAPEKSETEAERNERLRDDKGRFAPKAEEAKPAEVAKIETVPVAPDAPKDGETVLRPPPGWSPTAKFAFDKLPPEVQQAVAKREEEVNNGFAKFQEYKPIDRYMEMAKQSGTTLDKALENYVGIEQELSRDMIGGVSRICQNKGVHPVALANQILARYGAAPSEVQPGDQPQAHQTAPIDPNAIAASVREQIRAEQIQEEVNRSIKEFGGNPKNQFFENVRQDMTRLLQAGAAENLDDAYDKACWANPEIRALLIKQQSPVVVPSANAADAVQKAKAAAKATGGAPSAGFVPNPGTAGSSIRDTIRAAVNAQRGI